jgi:hypothetical protein
LDFFPLLSASSLSPSALSPPALSPSTSMPASRHPPWSTRCFSKTWVLVYLNANVQVYILIPATLLPFEVVQWLGVDHFYNEQQSFWTVEGMFFRSFLVATKQSFPQTWCYSATGYPDLLLEPELHCTRIHFQGRSILNQQA